MGFYFSYRHFYAYLKSRSRPWLRLQSWLHTPTLICIFKILSHWLSNWYLAVLLDTVIWNKCLWDTHQDPMCFKSIQTTFRPPRYVSKNGKIVSLHMAMSDEVGDWRWSQRLAMWLAPIGDRWLLATNMPHAVVGKQVQLPHEASEQVPADGVCWRCWNF